MPVTRTYQCPDCEAQFSFLHMTRDEPPPSYCAKCGNWMGETPEPMPAAPHIQKPIANVPDALYRKEEARSAALADQMGDPTLKTTDWNDNLREGDVAAKSPVNNPVTQYAEATAQAGVNPYFGNADVSGYVAASKSGPVRDTGARVLSAIQGGKTPGVPRVSAAQIKGSFGHGG